MTATTTFLEPSEDDEGDDKEADDEDMSFAEEEHDAPTWLDPTAFLADLPKLPDLGPARLDPATFLGGLTFDLPKLPDLGPARFDAATFLGGLTFDLHSLTKVDKTFLELLDEAEQTAIRAEVSGDVELTEVLRQNTFAQQGHLWQPTSESSLGFVAPHLQSMDPLALIGLVVAVGGFLLAGYQTWTTQEERLAHRKRVADWMRTWIWKLAK